MLWERRVWHFSNPENIALKAADKTWAGYYFGLEDYVPLLAVLWGVQVSSKRMSRPVLRLSSFFSLSAFPKYHPPEKTLSNLLSSYSLFQTWLICDRLKIGKREEGQSLAPFLP